MTLEEIQEIDRRYSMTFWSNNKNKKIYTLLAIAFDATNKNEGNAVAVYKSQNIETLFTREWEEFKQKFTEV